MFLNEIPQNLEEVLVPSKSVVVFDDCQQELLQSKEKIRMLKRLATIQIHHMDLMVFITFQDYEIFMPDLMFPHLKGHLPLLLGPPCLGSQTTLCFDKLTAALGRL